MYRRWFKEVRVGDICGICPLHCDYGMSTFGDIEKKGVSAPSFEPEVVSVDRPSESEAVDRIYDMKSELGAYLTA